MQTSYLQYMVEIDRTRSITQAAANLYLTQPNLSRILHEVEEQLGFTIFERSSRGVRPTAAGVAFLQHAKRILNEMDAISALGSGKRPPDRIHVCMPRSAGMLSMAADYLNTLPHDHPLDAMLRECHVRRAFEFLASGDADLGVIRFRKEYQDFFEDQATALSLTFEPLDSYRYQIIMEKDHPYAKKERIYARDLTALTEITHGDTFRSQKPAGDNPGRRVYSVDRHAQLLLVRRIPNAFMWATSMPPEDLEAWGLIQREVADNRIEYRNALVSIAPGLLSDIEQGFIAFMRGRCLR